MRIVCLLGKTGSHKNKISELLGKFGYIRGISYTTSKRDNLDLSVYRVVSEEDFKRLVDKDIIMEYSEIDGELYGSAHPIGGSNHVMVLDFNGYKKMKEIYKNQVYGVYLNNAESDFKVGEYRDNKDINETDKMLCGGDMKEIEQILNEVDKVIDIQGKEDRSIVADILREVSEI